MNDHTAQALILTCIDFRLQEAINKWISENFAPRTFDRVALAGGVKNLDIILSQIEIALRLHHIKKVILVNHEDCGAYGEMSTPEKNAKDLKNAKEKITQAYPNLEVGLYYLHLDGVFEPIN